MSRPKLSLLLLLLVAIIRPAVAAPTLPAPLAGRWKIDLDRSTELSPWKDYQLVITVDGDAITLERHLAWGPREFVDTMTVRPGQTVAVPVAMWPDNRHLGAYISDAHTKQVRAEKLDDGRLLRVSSGLVLETQQASRSVNILSDYKVSASGNQLTLTELRSTRNRPIVYFFTRVTAQ
jgi:hypothetical protein